MSDHLPECQQHQDDDVSAHCICPALRACEQRVLLSKPNIGLSAVYGYEAGRSDGLSAARDAVDRMGRYGTDEMEPWDSAIAYALDAIDALLGDA